MVLYRLLIRYTVILFLLFCGSLKGLHGQTMGVVVVSGGTVQFQFNSYQKINDGINYLNYSRLKIYSINVDPACKGWKLYCKSNSLVLSDDGFSSLSLSYVKVTPKFESSDFPGGTVVYPGFILSDIGVGNVIAESTTVGLYNAKKAMIVLDIAFATSPGFVGLIDVKSGYYYLDLVFKIEEIF